MDYQLLHLRLVQLRDVTHFLEGHMLLAEISLKGNAVIKTNDSNLPLQILEVFFEQLVLSPKASLLVIEEFLHVSPIENQHQVPEVLVRGVFEDLEKLAAQNLPEIEGRFAQKQREHCFHSNLFSFFGSDVGSVGVGQIIHDGLIEGEVVGLTPEVSRFHFIQQGEGNFRNGPVLFECFFSLKHQFLPGFHLLLLESEFGL